MDEKRKENNQTSLQLFCEILKPAKFPTLCAIPQGSENPGNFPTHLLKKKIHMHTSLHHAKRKPWSLVSESENGHAVMQLCMQWTLCSYACNVFNAKSRGGRPNLTPSARGEGLGGALSGAGRAEWGEESNWNPKESKRMGTGVSSPHHSPLLPRKSLPEPTVPGNTVTAVTHDAAG